MFRYVSKENVQTKHTTVADVQGRSAQLVICCCLTVQYKEPAESQPNYELNTGLRKQPAPTGH